MRRASKAISIAALLAGGCDSSDGGVAGGDPIAGTSITSCGDDLRDAAPPTGAFEGTLTVTDLGTTFQASVVWQPGCPDQETETVVRTEYVLTTLRILEDDAGSPGQVVSETAIRLEAVATCTGAADEPDRDELPATTVPSLSDACAAHLAGGRPGPPFMQVELEGTATTCSADEHPVLFRRQLAAHCPEP